MLLKMESKNSDKQKPTWAQTIHGEFLSMVDTHPTTSANETLARFGLAKCTQPSSCTSRYMKHFKPVVIKDGPKTKKEFIIGRV